MLRLRFSSGLILGLVAGGLAGVVVGMLMLPPRSADSSAATNFQMIELTRKLEAAKEDKERTERQLEQFQKLADQMTATFKTLEQRFNALEEAERLRAAAHPSSQPEAKAPAAAVPTPIPPTPTSPPSAPGDGAG
jgi:TolA-binding protein